MDIQAREEELLQKNASISAASSPKIEAKLPPPRHESRNRHPSDSSSISSINTAISNVKDVTVKETKPKRTFKKVNLAVVKQRKKDAGNMELLKTLDEYVRIQALKIIS